MEKAPGSAGAIVQAVWSVGVIHSRGLAATPDLRYLRKPWAGCSHES